MLTAEIIISLYMYSVASHMHFSIYVDHIAHIEKCVWLTRLPSIYTQEKQFDAQPGYSCSLYIVHSVALETCMCT